MPELPWEKWYPTNWASEPGLRLCEAATRGIWFEAVNTMMLQQNDRVSGTIEQLASLCICRLPQMQLAVEQLKAFKVADVVEQNGCTILICRKRARDCNIKELRRKAAGARWSKPNAHPHAPFSKTTHARSASASASASFGTEGSEEGNRKIPWSLILKWLKEACANGADYQEGECRSAWLALQTNGWMWGKNPILDYRAAIERQIQSDRQRNGGNGDKPKDDFWRNSQELKLVETEIEKIRGRASTTATGRIIESRDKPTYDKLRLRATELQKFLGLK